MALTKVVVIACGIAAIYCVVHGWSLLAAINALSAGLNGKDWINDSRRRQ